MAAVQYRKADWIAQADIQELADGRYRGVVMISHGTGSNSEDVRHEVDAPSDSPEHALEQAEALAHRLLADISG